MKPLTSEAEVVTNTARGPIAVLRVAGQVESDPRGLGSVVERFLLEYQPAGIVFDLTALRYGSWDDIGIHAVVEAGDRGKRPCCVLSTGSNRQRLEHFLTVTKLGLLLGGEVFGDLPSALAHVKGRLELGTA